MKTGKIDYSTTGSVWSVADAMADAQEKPTANEPTPDDAPIIIGGTECDPDVRVLLERLDEDELEDAFRSLARKLSVRNHDVAPQLAKAVEGTLEGVEADVDGRCLALELLAGAAELHEEIVGPCIADAAFAPEEDLRFSAIASLDLLPRGLRTSMLLIVRCCAERDPSDRIRELARSFERSA